MQDNKIEQQLTSSFNDVITNTQDGVTLLPLLLDKAKRSSVNYSLWEHADNWTSVTTEVDELTLMKQNVSATDAPVATVTRPLYEIIIVASVLLVLAVICILGNLLVCATIVSNRKLQSPTNFFILCLSISDLLLGVLVLPFSTIITVLPHWPLGAIFCNIYISTDVMLCTVSILTLFVISLDRYYAVTYPLRYVQRVTSRRVFWVCGSIWIFSFLMGFIPIHTGINTPDGHIQNHAVPDRCVFKLNFAYTLLIAIGTYFIPLIIMCAVYMKVYYIALKQVKRINQLAKLSCHLVCENGEHKSNARMVSESKATFTLASVVTAYAICWIPYFVLFTIKPFLHFEVNVHFDYFCLWLGYVNSLLNPFLYAFHNTEFRYAFMLILCKRYAERMKDKYTEITYL